jgi:hypothetical protein
MKAITALVLASIALLGCDSDGETKNSGVHKGGLGGEVGHSGGTAGDGNQDAGGSGGQETTDTAAGQGGCVSGDLSSLGGAPAASQVLSIDQSEMIDCPSVGAEPPSCPCLQWHLTLPNTFSVGSCANNVTCGGGLGPVQLTEKEVNGIVDIVTSPEFSVAQADRCSCTVDPSQQDGVRWELEVRLSSSDSIWGLCESPTVRGEQHPTVKLRNAFMELQDKYCTIDE